MTTKSAYAMGWIYGRLSLALDTPATQGVWKTLRMDEACGRPYTGFAIIHRKARDAGVITDEIAEQIGRVASEVPPDDSQDGVEKVMSLPLQGSYQLGYYKGQSGAAYPVSDTALTEKRKAKKLTQAQLAEMVGVDQSYISRIEQGMLKPDKELLDKINKVLE